MTTTRLFAWVAGLLLTTATLSSCEQKRDMDSGNGPDSSSTTDMSTDNSSSSTTSTDTSSTMMSGDTTSTGTMNQ